MKKNILIVAAIASILIIIGAVYFGIYVPQTQRANKADQWKQTLVIGTSVGRYGSPDPIGGYGDINLYLTLGHLLQIDMRDPSPSALRPVMAESWSLKSKPDGTLYAEFKIKQGLKFNDGTEVTAQAIKTSLERYTKIEPRAAWTRSSFSFRTLEAPDKYTLNAILENRLGYLGTLYVLAYYYGSIESPTGREKFGNGTTQVSDLSKASQIVGFAPYNTVGFTVNDQVVMEKNDAYPWADQYPWKKIIFQNFPDASALRLALEKGDIDVASYGLTKFDLQDLQSKPGVKVGWQEGHMRTLVMSYRYPPLDNQLVRQAIAEVINQDEIVKGAVPMCTPAYSLPQTRMGYNNDQAWLDLYGKHDLAKAKALMAQAGYPNGFKTELWIHDQYQAIEAETNVATIIKEQLAKIGITVEIKPAVYSIFTQKRAAGQLPLSLAGWWEDYPDVDAYVSYLFDSDQIWAKVSNITKAPRYAEVSALVKQGRNIYDPAKETPVNPDRKKIYDQVHVINAEDALYVPLYTEKRGEAWRDWVKGYEQPWSYQQFCGIPLYQLPTDKKLYKEPPPGMF